LGIALPLFYPLFQEELEKWSGSTQNKPVPFFFRLTKTIHNRFPALKMILLCNIKEKFYFKDKDDFFALAGLGNAWTIETSRADDVRQGFRKIWDIDASIPVFGGFSFYGSGALAPEWEPFNHCRFTLPLIEIRQSAQKVDLSINFVNTGKKSILSITEEITETLKALDEQTFDRLSGTLPSGSTIESVPNQFHWHSMVKKALHTISQDAFKKVVLARKKTLTLPRNWNPMQFLHAMSEIEENSFIFLDQLDHDLAFLGRSPERLFQLRGGRLRADAIAGTRPRGKNAFDDQRLEADLLSSPKETAEHRFVSGYIEKVMRRYCSNLVTTSREEILKLKNVQHIVTRFSGLTEKDTDPVSIVKSFHPTPAVGGYPKENILEYLRSVEPFDRGWYAAPIGWMSKNDADFAVAIRCALVQRNRLHIFAGAGIVRQSTPQQEWTETEKKMDHFTALLKEP